MLGVGSGLLGVMERLSMVDKGWSASWGGEGIALYVTGLSQTKHDILACRATGITGSHVSGIGWGIFSHTR